MNRSVLIVTPFFAPQNHSAVFRAYKLAKYLPQFGWIPTVLTVDTQYEFTEDDSLLTDLPAEVEVVAARYVEPSARGMRMALGGKDRTFKATRQGGVAGNNGSTQAAALSAAQRAYQFLIENWLQVPDAYWTWAHTATGVGKRIMRERGIDVVFTTAPPFSSLMIGQDLHEAGVRWVADLRDPLAYTKRLSSDSTRVYRRQRNIVKNALSKADAVTVAASCLRSIYFDMFGKQGSEPIFIPTGMDTNALTPATDGALQQAPYLIFPGEYLPDYDTAFLEAFAAALNNVDIRQRGVKLLVVGTLELNRTRLMPLIDKFGLHEHIEFRDQLPQRDVYKLLRGAMAGVLIPGAQAYWWTTFAKMTDYIGMRKPVVAVVPDPSEARTALTRTGLGVFLDGSPLARTHTLTNFLLGKHTLSKPDDDECERYTVRSQVQSFVEVFESVSCRH